MGIARETPDDVLAALREELNDSLASHFLAVIGLQHTSDWLNANVGPSPGNPDPMIFLGKGAPVGPNPPRYAQWTKSQAMRSLMPNGTTETRLSREWVISFYQRWEDDIRPRLTSARGLAKKDDIRGEVFGDLRLIRNDIVHKQGHATPDYSGKCTLLHWTKIRHPIQPTMDQLASLVDLIPWDELRG